MQNAKKGARLTKLEVDQAKRSKTLGLSVSVMHQTLPLRIRAGPEPASGEPRE